MAHKSPAKRKEYYREYNIKNKSKKKIQGRSSALRLKFGISLEDYNQMLDNQNYSCALCSRSAFLFNNQLAVDHCHETGRIRGLLCVGCNTSLGYLGDNEESLIKALNYVKNVNTGV